MKCIRERNALDKSFLVSVSILLVVFSTPLTLAHNFSSNESAMFLALVETIKSEAQLVQENLLNDNVSRANEHATKALALLTDPVSNEIAERNERLAEELNNALTTLKASTESTSGISEAIEFVVSDLDGIFDEIVTSRIDPDQLNNSTIQALTIVELLDKVLSNYGDAYEVGFDMTNMSMMMDDNSNGTTSMSPMEMNRSSSSNISMANTSAAEGFELVNITSYQTAQVLATKVQELFNNQITNGSADTQSLDNIATAVQELVSTIDNRGSPNDVMMIVHTKLHPNFITAFGLQLR